MPPPSDGGLAFEAGGWLRPAMSPVRNTTGHPIRVLTRRQWEDLAEQARRRRPPDPPEPPAAP